MNTSAQAIAQHFNVALPISQPNLYIQPGRAIPVVRLNPHTHQREIVMMQWGLIPHATHTPSPDHRLIFVRIETITHKPALRDAFLLRRCLIPADGFYEWKKERAGKQPYFVRLRTGHLFAFGGLWACDESQPHAIESCSILTTEANGLVRSLNPRMPLILQPAHYTLWLDPHTPYQTLEPLLQPYPAREMTAYPVTLDTNHPDHPDPSPSPPPHPGEEPRPFHPLFEEPRRHKPPTRSSKSSPNPDP